MVNDNVFNVTSVECHCEAGVRRPVIDLWCSECIACRPLWLSYAAIVC